MNPVTRRTILLSAAAMTLAAPAASASTPVTVHKDPNCDCCTGWVAHLEANGFRVRTVAADDIGRVKTRLGVPSDLAACHTAEAGGYVVEGHVPASALRKLLQERPKAIGLAVAGMPGGSPGMGGDPEPYDVVLFGKAGRRVYSRFKVETEI
jgi:hypothetical protein